MKTNITLSAFFSTQSTVLSKPRLRALKIDGNPLIDNLLSIVMALGKRQEPLYLFCQNHVVLKNWERKARASPGVGNKELRRRRTRYAKEAKLKVAMVVERFPPDIGGSGVRFCEIAERLSRKHAVDVFTLGPWDAEDSRRGFLIHRFNPDRLPVLNSYGFNRVMGLTFSTFFQFLFRSYDIVDIDVWPILPFFSAKIAQSRAPTVISWNVVWPFSIRKAVSRATTFFAEACSRLSTYNITVSNFAKRMLLEHVKMNPGRVSVIPNGNDEAFLRTKLEPKLGSIIFVGRLEQQKRLDLILGAFKIFKRSVNDGELHIVGSGPLRSQLLRVSEKIEGLHLHESIPGQDRDELASMLRKSWVFVSASEFESYGMSISEASSVGLPVVLTRTRYNGAIDEIVKHGYNGLIVDHDNPEAIADALERLYRDPELWKSLSSNAKRLAAFHSWDEVADRVEEVYEEVLNGRLPIDKSGTVSA